MAGKEFITTCTVKRSCEAVEALFHEEKARKSYALNGGGSETQRERRVARSNGSSIAERLSFRARLPDNPKLGTGRENSAALVTRYLCKRCIVCII